MRRLAAAAVLMLASCGGSADWTGFVYPDEGDLAVSVEIGRFSSYDQCRIASLRTLEVFKKPGGTFECGKRCSYRKDGGMLVCAETRD